MRDWFVLILVIIFAIGACIVSYRYGITVGQASCPVKYAVCENGTCTLSDVPPGNLSQ